MAVVHITLVVRIPLSSPTRSGITTVTFHFSACARDCYYFRHYSPLFHYSDIIILLLFGVSIEHQ